MKKKSVVIVIIGFILAMIGFGVKKSRNKDNDKKITVEKRKAGIYERYIKRILDVSICIVVLAFLWPVYLIIALLVKLKLGSPVLFTQDRPGRMDEAGKETIFKMYKFRSMSDARDREGNLLPDEERLTSFGRKLRASSLDELPEIFNILNGTMSLVGPRPQLIKDMVFMSDEQRMRHTVRPGLTGLAQVNGRNSISWDEKLEWDLQYIYNISFFNDLKILIKTFRKAILSQKDINQKDMATSEDFGDYLLRTEKINRCDYDEKQTMAKEIMEILAKEDNRELIDGLISIVMPSYNASEYIEKAIKSVIAQTYGKWELIIVDDCSTDNTVEIVNGFNDPRIRFFKNDVNSGAAISRNRALRESKGRYVAFLDSDDVWVPEKLEEQLNYMIDNDYAFTYTDYRIQLNGHWLPYVCTGPDRVNKLKMYNYCYFSTITVMYDQSKVGLIQIENLRKNNDYAMWLKAVERVDCYRYPKCMSYYIKHEGSVSSGSKLKLIKWHYLLFRKGQKYNPVISSVLTINNMIHGVIKKLVYRMYVEDEPVL